MIQTTRKPKLRKERLRGAVILNRREARELFDREARHWLGMSGDEFVAAWEAGKFDDNPDRPEVMTVVLLLPFYSPSETECAS
ncbi:MAG: hypothetical protein NTZ05_18180 [Chloroflexi bacterium]|nr:hypothetical protein [Chloroflexota bacterium]